MFREKFRLYFGCKIPDGEKHHKILCQWHSESLPSLDLSTEDGNIHCFGCGVNYHIDDLLKETHFIPEEEVELYHKRLMEEPAMMNWIRDTKGYTQDTLKLLKIGYNGVKPPAGRYTFPVRDAHGVCTNLRQYSSTTTPKMVPYAAGYGDPAWFPFPPTDSVIYLMEGETDTVLARQNKLSAFCQTGGAATWLEKFTADLAGKDVVMIYDMDRAGREGSQIVINAVKFAVKSIKNVRLPCSHGSKDFSEWMLKDGGDMTTLAEIVNSTPPYAVSKAATELADPVMLRLWQTSEAKFAFKPVEVTVTVSGKDRSPYLIPKTYVAECSVTGKTCNLCPNIQGRKTYELGWKDGKIIQFVDLNETEMEKKLKTAVGIPEHCRFCRIQITDYQNIEKTAMQQKHEWFNIEEAGEQMIARKAFFLGSGIQSNTSYRVRALPIPDNRDQTAVLLVVEAEPIADLEESEADAAACESFRVKLTEEKENDAPESKGVDADLRPGPIFLLHCPIPPEQIERECGDIKTP
jgi:hypothetical protein